MDLCQEFTEYLQIINDTDVISNETFDEIVSNTINILLNTSESEQCANIDPNGSKNQKAASSLLLTLGLFAQHNLTESQAKAQLEDYGLSGPRIGKIAEKYAGAKDSIRLRFDSIGGRLPHVTDCDWKLFHAVKGSQIEKPNTTSCLVNLQTNEGDVAFACNQIQLQNLVTTLREAVRCLERQTEMKQA